MTKKIVAYYRVSTKGQEISGLGLDAQRQKVTETAGNAEIVGEYTETESGRKKERPQLAKAIEHCKRENATLVIARLDRLARSVGFIFALKDSGLDFIACDVPDLSTITLAVLAGVAQHEAEIISERTKAALKAKKARGAKLGKPENLTNDARRKGVQAKKEKARRRNSKAYEIAWDLRTQGMSYNKIAQALERYEIRGAKGGRIYAANVRKILLAGK